MQNVGKRPVVNRFLYLRFAFEHKLFSSKLTELETSMKMIKFKSALMYCRQIIRKFLTLDRSPKSTFQFLRHCIPIFYKESNFCSLGNEIVFA